MIYSWKDVLINYLKIMIIIKFFFINYKCSIMIELTFLKELMLIRQFHQKSKIFVTIGIF